MSSASLPLLDDGIGSGIGSGTGAGGETIVCIPAGLVLVLGSIVSIVEFLRGRQDIAIFRFAITLILAAIVMLLCSAGMDSAAWLILAIPLGVIILFSVLVIFVLMLTSSGDPYPDPGRPRRHHRRDWNGWNGKKPTLEQSYDYVMTGKGIKGLQGNA